MFEQLLRSLNVPDVIMTLGGIALTAVSAYIKRNNTKAIRAYLTFEETVRDIVERKFGIPTVDTKKIHRDTIEASLKEKTKYDGSDSPIETVYTDGTYLAPTNSDEINVLKTISSITSYLPYRPEIFDCEDFANPFSTLAAFIGGSNTVGVVYDWSSGHAYNVIIDADGELTFYEPQDNTEVQIGDGVYKLEDALIVF